jgi:hypothetical protein
MRGTKVFEKLPGEAPKVFLPELAETTTKPATEPTIAATPTEPVAPATQPALSEAAQKARAALRETAEATKKAEIEARMTARDLTGMLEQVGAIIYDYRTNKYACWTCGTSFGTYGEIKDHFGGKVEVPERDLDALVATAKRARRDATIVSHLDRFGGDNGNGEGSTQPEVLVAGRNCQGLFYLVARALCAGRTVKVVPRGKRAWNVAALAKRILGDGVSAVKADGGVCLSLPLLPKTAKNPTSQ